MMEEEFVKQEVSDDLDADNNIHGQYNCKECKKVINKEKFDQKCGQLGTNAINWLYFQSILYFFCICADNIHVSHLI